MPAHFFISERESKILYELVQSLNQEDLNHPKPFINFGEGSAPMLLPSLSFKLKELRESNKDAIFITGLPVFTGSQEFENLQNTRTLALLIASMLGKPFQYKQQNEGEIVAHVAPEKGFENTHSSSGRMPFGWHTDDSFLNEPYRTDFITLCGYKNVENVRTNLSSINEIAKELPSWALSELMKPKFSLRLPNSFRLNNISTIDHIPLLWYDGRRHLNIAMAAYNVTPSDASDSVAAQAIRELLKATQASASHIVLQKGTMLIFRNNKYLHSRNLIKGERIVFRTYVKENLHSLQNLEGRNTFVFDLQKIIDSTLLSGGKTWVN